MFYLNMVDYPVFLPPLSTLTWDTLLTLRGTWGFFLNHALPLRPFKRYRVVVVGWGGAQVPLELIWIWVWLGSAWAGFGDGLDNCQSLTFFCQVEQLALNFKNPDYALDNLVWSLCWNENKNFSETLLTILTIVLKVLQQYNTVKPGILTWQYNVCMTWNLDLCLGSSIFHENSPSRIEDME